VPYSMASRLAKGESKGWMTLHAWWRAFLLVALGIFLRSIGRDFTRFTFEDTLTQIGLGYGVLFLLGFRKSRDAWIALGLILAGCWAAFALYPLPGPGFEWAAAGAKPDWAHNYQGFAAHWNKNTNLAWALDTWFLNLFPPDGWFKYNGGGYATLSFIPTLGTMILGLLAGRVMKSDKAAREKMTWLLVAGAIGIASGWLLDAAGICPSVKRIWTPSWTLFSGGWCFLLLAAFYAAVDLAGWRKPAFWLVVIGMNSIAAYMIAHLFEDFIRSSLRTHLGAGTFAAFGSAYEPFLMGSAILFFYWLILYWMYRRKLFLRI
jgi:heparan-alpha-glucosaminide N-acetyltransferase